MRMSVDTTCSPITAFGTARIVDRPPCSRCLHRNKMTVEEPCYSCIDLMDLSLHRPNVETEFASFTPATEVDHEE